MTRKITALTAQKRDPQRINVYLDGEFAFGLARIVAAWLYVGQELDEEKINHLLAEDGVEKGTQRAVNFISFRPRSEAEVRRNLSEHDQSEETIQSVIERLKNSGLIDDARFARQWVDNRSELRPRSRRALEYELRQRGVDGQIISQSLEEIDEEALALQVAQKLARKFKGSNLASGETAGGKDADQDWSRFRQKMYRALAQRGFNYEIISVVTQQVWAEISQRLQESQHQDSDEEEATP
jgi:regulatory protein